MEDIDLIKWIIFAFALGFVLSFPISISCTCFYHIFYSKKRRALSEDEFSTIEGDAYEPHKDKMIALMREIRSMPYTDVSVVSHDGLTLRGKYYEYKKGAPVEILFHGYRGSAERDFCGSMFRCFALEHNVLMVDHRASGRSEGRVITFGARESRDCLTWIDFVINEIDKDAKIFITGVSMGAATVMNAAGKDLPQNVVGVIADCGYTSTKDIVKKVMRDMKLPANIFYPFARIGAIILGGFDPERISPIKSMKSCRVPIIFFHGDADAFVPCSMSVKNFEACGSEKKRLVITHGADHGLCFPHDMEGYFREVKSFFDEAV